MKKQEVAKKMTKERFTENGRRAIQNFGQQHPDFMAARRETKRLQKGKASLLTPKGEKNEGEHNNLGRKGNEEPRS